MPHLPLFTLRLIIKWGLHLDAMLSLTIPGLLPMVDLSIRLHRPLHPRGVWSNTSRHKVSLCDGSVLHADASPLIRDIHHSHGAGRMLHSEASPTAPSNHRLGFNHQLETFYGHPRPPAGVAEPSQLQLAQHV